MQNFGNELEKFHNEIETGKVGNNANNKEETTQERNAPTNESLQNRSSGSKENYDKMDVGANLQPCSKFNYDAILCLALL